VTGESLSVYLARGAVSSSLGWPVGVAKRVTAHGLTGTVQAFQNGGTYLVGGKSWTVTGMIYRDYLHNGGPTGGLGWPTGATRSSTTHGGGWSKAFAGGKIYYSNLTKQAHPLTGSLLKSFLARGGVSSVLGWPGVKTSTTVHGGGSYVVFPTARLYSSKSGIKAVRTAVLTKYLALNGPAGKLGWPTGEATTSGTSTVQSFQHGRITVRSSGSVTVTYF
jgi:uncharacterized protein with LGFP repeats